MINKMLFFNQSLRIMLIFGSMFSVVCKKLFQFEEQTLVDSNEIYLE